MSTGWWHGFFDEDYLTICGGMNPPELSEREVAALWQLMGLGAGSRVLDGPCGFGRMARLFADRGAHVTGVDLSTQLLEHAETHRGGHGADSLRYLRHDLRRPLVDHGFDAAVNLFTSIGYGSEDDDLAILTTLQMAVKPGGWLFVETMHRDTVVARMSHGITPSRRDDDGTLVIEEPHFDPINGRLETTFHWSGPRGHGKKSASIRLYTPTELIALARRAGVALHSAHRGASLDPFRAEGPDMGGRLGLLLRKPT